MQDEAHWQLLGWGSGLMRDEDFFYAPIVGLMGCYSWICGPAHGLGGV